jgi:hypothetical protein
MGGLGVGLVVSKPLYDRTTYVFLACSLVWISQKEAKGKQLIEIIAVLKVIFLNGDD